MVQTQQVQFPLQRRRKAERLLLAVGLVWLAALAGCSQGDASKDAERELSIKEGDARATGSACRQAGRALEDCYTLNPESNRAWVYAGWKDMNDYMRENKMEDVKPVLEKPVKTTSSAESERDKRSH